jgi:hypothetical protein
MLRPKTIVILGAAAMTAGCAMLGPRHDEPCAPATVAVQQSPVPAPSWIEKLTPSAAWREEPIDRFIAVKESVIKSTNWVGERLERASQFPETLVERMTPSTEWREGHQTAATMLDALHETSIGMVAVLRVVGPMLAK